MSEFTAKVGYLGKEFNDAWVAEIFFRGIKINDCNYLDLMRSLEAFKENEVLLCILVEAVPEAKLDSVSVLNGFKAQFSLLEFFCNVYYYPGKSRLYYQDCDNRSASWCPGDPRWIDKFRSLCLWGIGPEPR